jgi:hypothetical protein
MAPRSRSGALMWRLRGRGRRRHYWRRPPAFASARALIIYIDIRCFSDAVILVYIHCIYYTMAQKSGHVSNTHTHTNRVCLKFLISKVILELDFSASHASAIFFLKMNPYLALSFIPPIDILLPLFFIYRSLDHK